MESCSIKRQWEKVTPCDLIAKAEGILRISKRPKHQISYVCESQRNTDFSVFTRNGIDYDRPLTPMEVAQKRVERLSREKRMKSSILMIESFPRLPTTDYFNEIGSSSVALRKIESSIYETPDQRKIAWCICMLNRNEVTGSLDDYITLPNIINLSLSAEYKADFEDGDCLQPASKCNTCQAAEKKRICCNVCFDDIHKISAKKRSLMSTFCGHVFCDTCVDEVIEKTSLCPVCRKKIKKKTVHRIYI